MKTIAEAALEKLKQRTSVNDHMGARIYLAGLLENPKLVSALEAIDELQCFHGYLTPGLKAARDEMEAILFANVRAVFTAESFNLIHGAL